MLKTYRSQYLIAFAFGVYTAEGALILFAAVALAYKNTLGVISSLAAALLVFPIAKLISTLFGLKRIATFQTDERTWLRVYGDGSDRSIARNELRSVKRTHDGIVLETSAGVIQVPNHVLGVEQLWAMLASWCPSDNK